jgi:predicted Fe-Mo cluster-binding NifX family protein
MKVAVTSKGETLDSPVDPRFGRAAYILIVDTETMAFEVMDNSENVNAFKGAGIQAATMISEKDVNALLTGFCGPNAFKILNAANINVANDISGTVNDAIDTFNQGKVAFADKANAEGHW